MENIRGLIIYKITSKTNPTDLAIFVGSKYSVEEEFPSCFYIHTPIGIANSQQNTGVVCQTLMYLNKDNYCLEDHKNYEVEEVY